MPRVAVGYFVLLLGLFFKLTSCSSFNDPHRVIYDGDTQVAEGAPFKISCKMSLLDPSEWTLNNDVIEVDDEVGYFATERDFDTFHKELTLLVELAQLHHEGEYRCNKYSRDFHFVHVVAEDVDEDKSEDRQLASPRPQNEFVLKVNTTIPFHCSSAKDDDTPVTWYKDSRRIVEHSDSNIEISGHYLIIQDAQEDDAGQYMCTVDTPFVTGYTDIGRIFHLNSAAKIFDFPIKVNIIQGRSLTLHCKTQGFPPPRITWYIGNLLASELAENDNRILIYSSDGGQQKDVLTVREVSNSDKGLYTCRAENSIDLGSTVERDEESAFVHIRENMIETNEDEPGMGKILIPGHKLVLQCNTSECPQCRVVWYKDDVLLSPIDNHLQIFDENNSIVINRASYADAGVYICAIDRKQLDVALNASITVQSEIKLEKFDQSAVVFEGSPLELCCKAKGAPLPSIKWFRDDEEISESHKRIKLLDDGGLKNAKLLIEEANYEDRHHYTCEAFNKVISVNTTIFIRIKDKLAALWPFLGICLEVVILCTIIFVYERRKSMSQCDETETDLPVENKNVRDRKAKGQDVRQRK